MVTGCKVQIERRLDGDGRSPARADAKLLTVNVFLCFDSRRVQQHVKTLERDHRRGDWLLSGANYRQLRVDAKRRHGK